MEGALIILGVTVAFGLLLYSRDVRQRRHHHNIAEPKPQPKPEEGAGEPEVCCGMHLVCERDFPTDPLSQTLYFEDEELDRFAGRSPQEYTPAEADEFRDVMLTMRPEETPLWARALQKRGINPPEDVMDELMLIIKELTPNNR